MRPGHEPFPSRLARHLAPLREPRRALAVTVLGLGGGLMVAFLAARGSASADDAFAYWAGVRAWLAGGDPYHPAGPWWPYVYPPWLLPALLPWGLLPWDVAWFAWRATMVLLFLWSAAWAYQRRPLATATVLLVIGGPLGVVIDSGNVILLLALAIWATQFVGPRLGGLLWALATAVKWFPAIVWIFLPPRARPWGLVFLGAVLLLALATWPETLTQIAAATVTGPPRLSLDVHRLRLDHLILFWGLVPWAWRQPAGLRWPRSLPPLAPREFGSWFQSLLGTG